MAPWHWFDWLNNRAERQDLIYSFIISIVVLTFYLRPTKKEYKNILIAWTIFTLLEFGALGFLYLLFFVRILPVILTSGINEIYWMAIVAAIGLFMIVAMDAITKQIGIKLPKEKNEKSSDSNKHLSGE